MENTMPPAAKRERGSEGRGGENETHATIQCRMSCDPPPPEIYIYVCRPWLLFLLFDRA